MFFVKNNVKFVKLRYFCIIFESYFLFIPFARINYYDKSI